MAVPKPPQPGQAVSVKFNEPYGDCGGVVTRVVGHNVYVCYEGEAHEYEEPLDWRDPAVRRIVTVQKPPPVANVTTHRARQDRRSRAEKATGWGGRSRRRRRKPANPAHHEPEVIVKHEHPDASSPAVVSQSAPFIRTPSGRLIAISPGRSASVLPRRTISHQLLEHSHETLLSEEQRLEAEARRLEEELERELPGSIASLSLSYVDASGAAATTIVDAPAEHRESKGGADKTLDNDDHSTEAEVSDGNTNGDSKMMQQASCGALFDNLASPTPEASDPSEDAGECALRSVDWEMECSRLREREKDHLREIQEKDRQIKMLQAMLSAVAGLRHSEEDATGGSH